MTERILKITLRTLVTLGNLPLLLLAALAFGSERSVQHIVESLWAQYVLLSIAAMAAGNMIVCWRWRATADVPFSILYKLFRGFLWVVNLAVLLLIGVGIGSTGDLRISLLLLPSASAVLALVLTGRQKPEHAPPNEKPLNAKAELAKHASVAQSDIQTYYAAHYAEIHALRAEYERVLVDKYGFQPDFVRDLRGADAEAKAATEWHIAGKTAEQAADELFNLFYHSPEANNPKIFARHVETGEPLPPDFNHNDWRDKFLGRSSDQKVMSAVMLVLGAAFSYGFYADVFLPSREWFFMSLAVTCVLTLLLGINLFSRWTSGRIRAQPGRRQPTKWDALWVLPLAALLLWFMVYLGAGSVGNAFAGEPMRQSFAYQKTATRHCLRITETAAFTFAKLCLKEQDDRSLPQTGFIDASGRRSWFGVSLDSYHMPFNN